VSDGPQPLDPKELEALGKTFTEAYSEWVEVRYSQRGRWVVIYQKDGATVGGRFQRLSHAHRYARKVHGVVRHFHRRMWMPHAETAAVRAARSVVRISYCWSKSLADTAIATTVTV
jgi:hypothetical protein